MYEIVAVVGIEICENDEGFLEENNLLRTMIGPIPGGGPLVAIFI
jgi:hypothetical protein